MHMECLREKKTTYWQCLMTLDTDKFHYKSQQIRSCRQVLYNHSKNESCSLHHKEFCQLQKALLVATSVRLLHNVSWKSYVLSNNTFSLSIESVDGTAIFTQDDQLNSPHGWLLTHNSQLNNVLNKDMHPVLTVVPKHPAIQYNLAIAKLMSSLHISN